MSLRVTGGILRSRRLDVPGGRGVRPTPARVREAMFSIVGQHLDGRSVLDGFAGSGSLGIEAASRGAGPVVFVERDRAHGEVLSRNAALLDELCEWRLQKGDLLSSLDRLTGPFDLVLLDPPYRSGLATQAVIALGERPRLLSARATVVLEAEREDLPPVAGCLVREKRRSYGKTELHLYRVQEAG